MEEKNKDVKEIKKEEVKKEESKETKKVENNKNKNEEPKFKKVDKNETEKQTKKNETKKEKNSKKITWIPTTIGVVVVLLIAVLLTFMIVKSSSPKKSLDALLTNLKAGDFEKTQEYISGDANFTTDSFDIDAKELLFDKLGWKINKVTENDDNTATIEVEITTKDFKTIINNYMQKILEAARGAIIGGSSEQTTFSSDDFEKYFIDELKNESIETTTINTTINAIKENDKWKIVSDEALTNSILPGLQEAVNAL